LGTERAQQLDESAIGRARQQAAAANNIILRMNLDKSIQDAVAIFEREGLHSLPINFTIPRSCRKDFTFFRDAELEALFPMRVISDTGSTYRTMVRVYIRPTWWRPGHCEAFFKKLS
jgi:hypothetical protein